MEFQFSPGFGLGVSSAAAQIEGGRLFSSWQDWYERGYIKDGSDPSVADDHWVRWREDVDLMARMGVKLCRFGIEWARLMPGEGKTDSAAVARYREEIEYMLSRGIKPLLTIHHFNNPLWFEKKGGFEKKENLHFYLELAELTVKSFGDLVSEYITINEPNVYAVNGFFFGSWPPGKKSMKATFDVLSNMAWCHIKAYGIIHNMRRDMGFDDTMVSFANHVRVFDPKDGKNPWHRLCAAAGEWLFQGAVTRAMCLGDFAPLLRSPYIVPRGEYADFIGVNYYSRSAVSGLADGTFDHCPKNDLGWEIYPEGIVRCTQKLVNILDRPVWVTENGTCDNEDKFRAKYIFEHLKAMADSGLDFERYYHWCFCDNFEWLEGQSARFGLVKVDYDTQKRTVKRSGEFYSEMIKAGGVTEEMFQKYVKDGEYR